MARAPVSSRRGDRRPHRVPLVGLALALACASSPALRITPVADPPTGRAQPGRFVWVDLVTHDVAGAKAFYGALFGWDFAGEDDGYVTVLADGRPIAGIVDVQRPEGWERESGWLGSLSVEDVDRAARIVAERGGTVERGPLDAPERGRMALVRDPSGAHLLLLRADGGDPPDGLPPLRRFFWRELWTQDVEAALGFYGALADYRTELVDLHGQRYRVLMARGVARAGVVEAPADVDPQWLPYVRVADALEIADRAAQLGAHVVHREDRAVILVDPTGAPIGVQVWNPQPREPAQ